MVTNARRTFTRSEWHHLGNASSNDTSGMVSSMNAYDSKMSSGVPRPARGFARVDRSSRRNGGHRGTPGAIAVRHHPQQAETTPEAPALLSDLECFTFSDLSVRIRAYAAWAQDQGLKRGDRVALLMRNARNMSLLAGLEPRNRHGADQRHSRRPLAAHCLEIAAPAHVIVEAPLAESFTDCAPRWPGSRRNCGARCRTFWAF